ncbi:HD-GYP domain, c-di-GMP phosphodiesterase class II (or its inactivated variant) [Marinobacter persicus]|uniref:HD-GYP domain, c-di-GMP phosphodiesterase class II (Or its inactivated variant) n=2 Tax=Marinobacter persicus TaxID=930118 RepID=A0A1I3WRV7_9GAMM|nr:HD-GYP domain, c-di-GMP phosphodiesterase class II (or its inactivated variant) [Marinobacter persicus]
MFVSDLDRPWHQTPFPIQGFHVRSQADIQAVVSHCRWVMIDVDEGRASLSAGGAGFGSGSSLRGQGRETLKLPPLNIRQPVRYQTEQPLEKEVKACQRLLADAERALQDTFVTLQSGKTPDTRPAEAVTRKVVASVVRQPNALLWLSRTRQFDDLVYRHALNTAVWALVCGRQLGLKEELLNHLGLGCLLSQVGKTTLPRELLRHEQQLSREDYQQYRSYVSRGVEMLAQSGLPRAVMTVVENHRERHNGSGFPQGIRGDRIPVLAKVAGIAEFFESLVAPREDHSPLTPARAVALLYDMRNIEFQEDLVETFIQAIGVYPTGSLVELSDGQRGVVVSHSPERRLWPRVMVMQDAEHKPLKSSRILDLARINEGRDASQVLKVLACLPSGTRGLDPSAYDLTGGESRWSLGRLIGR